jgi:hypothetical protein
VKSQHQAALQELETVNSNHQKLLLWTIDMNEAIKAIARRFAESIGVKTIDEEREQPDSRSEI